MYNQKLLLDLFINNIKISARNLKDFLKLLLDLVLIKIFKFLILLVLNYK